MRSLLHESALIPSPAARFLLTPNAFLATLLLAVSLGVAAEDKPPQWVVDARQSGQALGGQLKQALTSAVESDGLVAAVEVCQIQAPLIAERVSDDSIEVGRTALRVRNPANSADAWERRILENFERQMARGEDPAGLETFAVRHVDGKRRGHWMKAIPTGGMCLSCHGSQLDPQVQQTIDQRYPQDQATGFSQGSLRGAFSVEITLPDTD